MSDRKPCACRRQLTESELFAAHGVGRASIVEHDELPHVPPRITADVARERYAREAPLTVLTRLRGVGVGERS